VHAVVTEATAVLDAVHTRGDTLLHARERMRVRGDGKAEYRLIAQSTKGGGQRAAKAWIA